MHRDLKLGLALAVLLIGATTAFFFRTDADLEGGLPQLQNPERLDAELAGRAAVPYLGAPESDPIETASASPWSKPAFLGGAAPVRRTSVTPDPIRILLQEEAELIEPGPELPPVPAAETEPPVVEHGHETPVAPTTEGFVHVVRAGDTLSGLAAQYLGDVSRFGEIFELNRDRLGAPHDLKIGMEVRIPPKEGPTTAVDPPAEPVPADVAAGGAPIDDSASAAAEPAVGTGDTKPDAAKMFVPARKMPFVPSRYRSGGVPSADADRPADPKRE